MSISGYTDYHRSLSDSLPALIEAVFPNGSLVYYDAKVCRAIIRQFQMNPSSANNDLVNVLLARSLAALPSTDFVDAFSIISPENQTEISNGLYQLDLHLQRAQFPQFWELASNPSIRNVLNKVDSFDNAIREFIIGALSHTFQSSTVEFVKRSLNTDDLNVFVEKGLFKIDGNSVIFPITGETTPRPKRQVVDIPSNVRDIGTLLQSLSANPVSRI